MPPIVVVTGFPRCGTSLTMRMLHTGGIPVIAENHYSYEDERTTGSLNWLQSEGTGKAVKVLVSGRLPPGFPSNQTYRFIWLNRDYLQQAKSQAKLVGNLGVKMPISMMAAQNRADRPRCIHQLWRYRGARVLELGFEDLIKTPLESAQTLQRFLPEFELNPEAMAKVVVPRSTDCYPGFLEIQIFEGMKDDNT